MAPEKVTIMVLDVDLKCSHCYKKVKKIIRKIPEIRDQEYEVYNNKVKIIVVCVSPEKIRDKLCYKGGNSIQKIEVIAEKLKDQKPADKPKEKGDHAPPVVKKPDSKPEMARMAGGYPPPNYHVVGYGCECHGGGYVVPPQPPGYGYGYGSGYGHVRGYDHGYNGNASRDHYYSEENAQGCSVM
ncbi:unnamed protein product [Lactuca virosa]|uniref:HMA domain-containing protein n=1 Tax=Lactuca virosa TaxID=75947 RepID=A0AAU9M2G6_9ASTR|nr:unnamed protein product [Lactuca virosa]